MSHKIDFMFLLRAIKEQVAIDVYIKRDQQTQHFGSRFLDLHEDEKSIIIECPAKKGIYHKEFSKGDRFSVAFQNLGFRFNFDTRVKEVLDRARPVKDMIPAVRITTPEILVENNRRSLSRVSVCMKDLIQVIYEFVCVEEEREKKAAPAGLQQVEAVMMDLSENGMAIQVPDDQEIRVGDFLRFHFNLGDSGDGDIEMEGIVRNIRQEKGKKSQFCGVEFLPGRTGIHKRGLQRIAAFAMSHKKENVSFFNREQVVSRNFLVQKIADGEVSDDVIGMLLDGQFTLMNEEKLEALVYIAENDRFREAALKLLRSLPQIVKEVYVGRTYANHRVANYILSEALESGKKNVMKAVVKNPFLPVQFLMHVARAGDTPLLGMLIGQDSKLIAYPEIMEVMVQNPYMTPQMMKTIENLKQQYLIDYQLMDIPKDPVIQEVSREVKEERQSLSSTAEKTTSKNIEDHVASTWEHINRLTIGERIKMAFTGNKSERLILARDPNQIILSALLENPKITDGEIVTVVQNRRTEREIVSKVARNKIWQKNNTIVLALVKNPKLPVTMGQILVNRIKMNDLTKIEKDKNIHPDIRRAVENRLKEKT